MAMMMTRSRMGRMDRMTEDQIDEFTFGPSPVAAQSVAASDPMADEDPEPAAGQCLTVTPQQFDILRHDCKMTLVSPKTGDHRTFKISTVRSGAIEGKRIVSLLTGPDNESDFEGFGFVLEDGRVVVWKRFRGQDGEKSQHEKLADLIARPAYWAARGVEYLISLKCRRCGRDLTRPDSIADGMGPICREKAMGL